VKILKITAPTMVELLDHIYKRHGWVRKAGESRAKRAKQHYDFTTDHEAGRFVAIAKGESQ